MAPVELVEYDADWPLRFDTIRQHIAPHLPPGTAVEHVGSTAVPGMVGKPVIDVDVVVQDIHVVAEVVATLAWLGFAHRGDLGIAGRQAFDACPGWPPHHVYLVVQDSEPYRDHVDLREHLRAHPDAARRYSDEKRRLVRLGTPRERYTLLKGELVTTLLADARSPAGSS